MLCDRLLPLGALALLTTLLSASAVAEVLISEIMYNPDGYDVGTGFNKEWVEIFNTGTGTVDLSGWYLEDIQDSDASLPLPNGTLLDPGEALVLTPHAATFDLRWGTRARRIKRIELSTFPSLANDPSAATEILALKDDVGIIRDIVNYDDEGSWPMDVEDGPSIYVLPDSLSTSGNNDGANWFSSTPGVDGAFYNEQSPFGEKGSPGFVATETTVFPHFTPSPDASWSMVVFPDTQNYVKTQAHLPLFFDMAEWVRDNRDDFNIQLVLLEGDIVNRNRNESPPNGENPSTLQWQNAKSVMSTLDGVVPYIMSAGNHDYGINDSEDRSTRLNEFFSASDNSLVDPAQSGILKGLQVPGHLENAYYEMTAPDGRKLLIFSFGWDPQQAQLNWANQVAGQSKYDDFTVILLTHDYLNSNDLRSMQGDTFWEELVKRHGNFEMAFNGHVGADGTAYLASTGDAGNQVHQMLFNTQFEGNGGNGWIRLLEFLDDGTTVRARTYSPTFGFIREDTENGFTFTLTPLDFEPADFTRDGAVDAADLFAWKAGFGMATGASWLDGDADGDGDVDITDLAAWQRSFIGGPTSAIREVPEPATLILVVGAVIFLFPLGGRHTCVTPDTDPCISSHLGKHLKHS